MLSAPEYDLDVWIKVPSKRFVKITVNTPPRLSPSTHGIHGLYEVSLYVDKPPEEALGILKPFSTLPGCMSVHEKGTNRFVLNCVVGEEDVEKFVEGYVRLVRNMVEEGIL